MPATEAELTYARSYIGNTEADDVFNERVDRLDSTVEFDTRDDLISAGIEESLRAQLAAFATDGPSQVSLGSMSQGTSGNLSSLAAMLKDFKNTKGSSHMRVTRMWRQPVR